VCICLPTYRVCTGHATLPCVYQACYTHKEAYRKGRGSREPLFAVIPGFKGSREPLFTVIPGYKAPESLYSLLFPGYKAPESLFSLLFPGYEAQRGLPERGDEE